jgi:hypothetical protein
VADDYLTRVARAARERREEERREQRENRRRELDRLFEANKHMSTLSVSGLVLVFAAGQLGVLSLDVKLAMLAFSVPLVTALSGMRIAVIAERLRSSKPEAATVAGVCYIASAALFTLGILFTVVLSAVP